MNHDENDELWHLLGRAKAPRVSPFFSRNVLRALREERSLQPGLFARLLRRWELIAVGAAAAVAVAALIPREEPADPIVVLAHQVSTSPDYSVIGNLDELLAFEESSVWLEHGTY